MSNSPPAQSNGSSSRWADLRDICSAIREVVVVLTMILLLIAPSVVRQTLERAGIRSVAGVEFDIEKIAESRDEVDVAMAQVEALKKQLATAQHQVDGLAESSPAIAPPATISSANGEAQRLSPSPSLSSVSRLLASMKNQADDTEHSLRRSRVHTDKFLEQAGKQIELTPPDELFRNRELAPTSAAQPAALDSFNR